MKIRTKAGMALIEFGLIFVLVIGVGALSLSLLKDTLLAKFNTINNNVLSEGDPAAEGDLTIENDPNDIPSLPTMPGIVETGENTSSTSTNTTTNTDTGTNSDSVTP